MINFALSIPVFYSLPNIIKIIGIFPLGGKINYIVGNLRVKLKIASRHFLLGSLSPTEAKTLLLLINRFWQSNSPKFYWQD